MTEPSPAPAAIAEGEFRFGRVLGTTFSVLLQNLPRFFAVAVVAYLPSLLTIRALPIDAIGTTLAKAVLILLALLLAASCNLLGQAVVLHGAFQQMRRRPIRLVESLKLGVRRLLPLLGLVIVEVALAGVASLAFIIPALILFAIWAVTTPVCVLERRGPFASLSRSAELTKGHRWKVFALTFPLFVIDTVTGSFLEDTLSAAGSTPLTLAGSLIWNGLWGGFYAIAFVVTYHELRVAKEGIDIEQIAAVFD